MFFSPGFGPLLFRNNGALQFQKLGRGAVSAQDGTEYWAWWASATALSIGGRPASDRSGYLLPEPETRSVAGRPLVGLLGREILPDDAIVDLNIFERRVTISRGGSAPCPMQSTGAMARPVPMQHDILSVPIRINGHQLEAVLDPDLPVTILPKRMAEAVGLREADLAVDPSVRTTFGKIVRGVRHRVTSLTVGDVHLHDVAVDVEDEVRYPLLGLNVFAQGDAVFDFQNGTFAFRPKSGGVEANGDGLHFDETRVAHVTVQE